MNDMPPATGQPDDEDPYRLSVGDPVLGKTRLLARECGTCIFRPGNLMHLSAGRLKQLVTEACDQAGFIICHQTLPYAGSPVPPAICRGFADRYSTWQLQVIDRLWGFVEVPPPASPAHQSADDHRHPAGAPIGRGDAAPDTTKEMTAMADIDDVLRRQDEIIDRVGWAVMLIVPTERDPDTATPFAYTVGLTAHAYPELLIAGLPPEVAHGLLNDLAGRVYDTAQRFSHGQRISDLIAGYDAVIVEGSPTSDLRPGAAIARYDADQVRLQQVVWPDPRGRFPWERGYNFDPHAQPLIAHL